MAASLRGNGQERGSDGCWVGGKAEREAREVAALVLDECIALGLGRAIHEIQRDYGRLLRPLRLTTAQLRLLSALALRGPVGVNELARQFGVDKAAVSRTVRRAMAKGWLDVAPADDLETAALVLSAAGQRVLRGILPVWKRGQGAARARVLALLSRR